VHPNAAIFHALFKDALLQQTRQAG